MNPIFFFFLIIINQSGKSTFDRDGGKFGDGMVPKGNLVGTFGGERAFRS